MHSVMTKESLLSASYFEAGVKTPEQNGKVPSGDVASMLRSHLHAQGNDANRSRARLAGAVHGGAEPAKRMMGEAG